MINKVEEIRIPCECVGGSILEAIPNTNKCSKLSHYFWPGLSENVFLYEINL